MRKQLIQKSKCQWVTIAGILIFIFSTGAASLWTHQKKAIATTLTELNTNSLSGERQLKEQENSEDSTDTADVPIGAKTAAIPLNRTSVKEVLKQISVLYGVEIVIKGKLNAPALGGHLSLTSDLEEMMKSLEFCDHIHYSFENNKVIVWQ